MTDIGVDVTATLEAAGRLQESASDLESSMDGLVTKAVDALRADATISGEPMPVMVPVIEAMTTALEGNLKESITSTVSSLNTTAESLITMAKDMDGFEDVATENIAGLDLDAVRA